MREGKRYLSLFLAAAITVTGVNAGTAFQVDAASVSAREAAAIGSPDDGKSKLSAEIAKIKAENLDQNRYTAETWTKLQQALTAAETVLEKENATEEEYQNALTALTTARTGLVVSGDDGQEISKESLNEMIEKAEGKEQNKYTPATWAKLQEALTAAKAVAAKADATQAEINEAYKNLDSAIKALIVSGDDGQEKADKTALKAEIDKAKALTEADYKPETWTAFKTVLAAAEAVYANENATQTDVNTALTNLTKAMAGLEKVSPDDGQEVNKTALKAKIDEVKKAQATYTPASWDAFKPALAAAEAVAAKADAIQKEVDDALTALNTAIAKLVKVANKTELKKSIDAANKLNKAAYTPASWTKLQTALTAAKSADANANATQAQVDQACASLKTAINTLVKVANKAELKKSIDAANKLKKADYTSSTWKKFDAALKEAKAVYSNANATQAQVDAAKKKLDDAKKALKKKVIKVTKVKITNGKSLKIAAGKKVTLKTTVAPKNASNKKVKWSISKKDKKYATVSAKGVVTTKKAGKGKTVTVTATAADGSKKKATVKISIMKNAVTKVTLKAKSKTLKVGKKVTVKATVRTNGKKANKKLAWKSSNTKYATVSSKGVVTAKKAGKGKTVTITATATDGSNKKGTIKIKIKK